MIEENEIDECIARFLSGEAKPEEAMALEDWRELSTANEQYFARCCMVFGYPHSSESDDQPAWEEIKKKLEFTGRIQRASFLKWTAGIAASLVVITVAAVLFHGDKQIAGPDYQLYTAGATEKKILLDSASEVVLFPGAQLIVKNRHAIHLKGSASFSIAHDTMRSLAIETGNLVIKDIGTRFSITTSANNDTILVSVTEGEVSIHEKNRTPVEIYAGNEARYISATRELKTQRQNIPGKKDTSGKAALKQKGIAATEDKHEQSSFADQHTGQTGNIVLGCNSCAESGQLELLTGSQRKGIKTDFEFSENPAGSTFRFRYSMHLLRGEYKWLYRDGHGNNDSGRVTIESGKEQLIRLLRP
jgi:ferric-dicitrate binding protein FerR (iron transport regulator)